MFGKAVVTLIIFVLSMSCSKEGPKGDPGERGESKTGLIGQDGAAGKDGQDGKDGTKGKDGADGKDGVDGKDGAKGEDLQKIELRNLTVSTDRPGALLTNLTKTLHCSVELFSSDGHLPKDSRLVMNIIADDEVRVANLPTHMAAPGIFETTWNWDGLQIGNPFSVQCQFQLVGAETLIADQKSARISYFNELRSEYSLAQMDLSMKNRDDIWRLVLTPNSSLIRQDALCTLSIEDPYSTLFVLDQSFYLQRKGTEVKLGSLRERPKHLSLLKLDINCGPAEPGPATQVSAELWVYIDQDKASVSYFPKDFEKNPYTSYAYTYLTVDKELPYFEVVPAESTEQMKQLVKQRLRAKKPTLQNLQSLQSLAAMGPRFASAAIIDEVKILSMTDEETCEPALQFLDEVVRDPDHVLYSKAKDALQVGLSWTLEKGKTCRDTALRLAIVLDQVPASAQEEAETYFKNNANRLAPKDWKRICLMGSPWKDKFLKSQNEDVASCLLIYGQKTDDYLLIASSMLELYRFGLDWNFIKSRVKDPGELILALFKTTQLYTVPVLGNEDVSKLKTFLESNAEMGDGTYETAIQDQWQWLAPAVTGASPALQAMLLKYAKNIRSRIHVLLAANPTSAAYYQYFKDLSGHYDPQLQLEGLVGRLAMEQNDEAWQSILNFVQANDRSLDFSSMNSLARVVPYLGPYKKVFLEKLILPYVSAEYCESTVLDVIGDLALSSESILDFVEKQLRVKRSCSPAVSAAIALGRDVWKERAVDLLSQVQSTNHLTSDQWVRPATVLYQLGFYKDTLQRMILSDLDTAADQLELYNPYGTSNPNPSPDDMSKYTLILGELRASYSESQGMYPDKQNATPVMSFLYSIGARSDFATETLVKLLQRPMINQFWERQIGFVLSQTHHELRRTIFHSLIQSQFWLSRDAAFYFADPRF